MPHIHEKIDFCSETFVVYKNKVLLRIHDKVKIWLSVGGHIELNEDPNEAAIREVREEVGLNITLFQEKDRQPKFKVGYSRTPNGRSLIPPQYLLRHRVNENHEHVAFVYFAESKTDVLKLSDREITEECKWFTQEELIKNDYGIHEDIRFYALQALKKISK